MLALNPTRDEELLVLHWFCELEPQKNKKTQPSWLCQTTSALFQHMQELRQVQAALEAVSNTAPHSTTSKTI